MKMSRIEKLFIRSPLRVYLQRKLEAPAVLSKLNLGKESVCLEIGCGGGAGALLINQYLNCQHVVGVDIDPDMIKASRRYISRPPRWARNIRTDNIEFLCQEASNLPFPDGYFDAAFMFGVLDHIRDWPGVVAEVFRVLKVGGVFSFEEFLLSTSANNRLGHVSIREMELRDVLSSTGFSIQSFQMMKHLPRCLVRAVKGV